MKTKNVTIAEVARRAGVSTATAGRVLGGYGYSSPRVREKVWNAAKALDYRPNLLARSLITGRTRTVGVVAGDIESPFYAAILRGIANVLERQDFGMLITNSDENVARERRAVELLLEKQIDGLIISPCLTGDPEHLHVAARRLPVVLIDRDVSDLNVDSVGVDNVAAAKAGVTRLLQAGHRRIGVLAELEHSFSGELDGFLQAANTGDVVSDSLYPSWQRVLGYLLAHREKGVEVDRELVRRTGAYSIAAAEREMQLLLSLSDPPDAVFTTDGAMSAGAMAALRNTTLRTPMDLSFLAFDDLDWLAFVGPGIDAIAQPRRLMGEAAAKALFARMSGDEGPPRKLRLPTRFISRGSIRKAYSSAHLPPRP